MSGIATNIVWGVDSEINKPIGENAVRSTNNEIYFNGEVNQVSIISLMKEIDSVLGKLTKAQNNLLQSTISPVEIILYIDSYGGTVKDCFKFIDHINILKKNHGLVLTTVCNGVVASAATLMALCGDKRYITKHSTYMIHELFSYSIGTYTHLTSRVKHINILHEHIINLYLHYVPQMEREHLLQLLQTESWFSADECVKMGFAELI